MFDYENQNRQREIIQNNAEKLSLENKHLLITWATGCGKGRAVMRCIAASTSKKKWLVICPEILQVQNFINDLDKHGYSWLLEEKIEEVICYASFKKYENSSYNLALNECHRLSELRYDIGKTISFDQIVSDSATVPTDIKYRLHDICPFYEYHISLKEAIEKGILPAPTFYVVKVDITDTEQKQLTKLDNTYKMWKTKYGRENQIWQLNKMKRARQDSKVLLSSFKTNKVREIIETLGDSRLICFTGSIEQCSELGGERAIHSGKNKKNNLEILEKFNNFEINSIFVNRMGREGLNLEKIEATVVTQLDSGNDEGLSFLQITGRGLRGIEPKIYLLYIDIEQDRKYLERALKNVDKKYIVRL